MTEFTFQDLEILKNAMVQLLQNFDGTVAEKQIPDSTYLKLLELSKEIAKSCELNKISPDDMNDLKITTNYTLDELIERQIEKQNLLLDF